MFRRCLRQCKLGKDRRIEQRQKNRIKTSVTVCCDGADGDDSQESEGEDVGSGSAPPPAANGGTAEVDPRQQALNDSEADSEEEGEEGDEEEENKGDAEGQAADKSREHSLVASQ